MYNQAIHAKIWLHAIIPVAGRLPLINADNNVFITKTIVECFNNQSCKVEAIAAEKDHMHILFLWEPALSPADVIEGVCYESTKLINGSLFQANAFAWENTKAIFSVSHSQMPKVAEYIGNQKAVHSEKSFSKELDDFLILHALK